MCFSATASVAAGVTLSTIGIVSLKKVTHPAMRSFAAIPLLFGVQQFTEALLWMALPNPQLNEIQVATTHLFLIFAQFVWPLWVPYSVLRMEVDIPRIKPLRVLLVIGGMVSAYLGYCLLVYPVKAVIEEHHIAYLQDYPLLLMRYGRVLYVATTVLPPFVSSVKRAWLVGFLILVSYIATNLFYSDYLVSVWCYFASILSMTVYHVIKESEVKAVPAS